jgi:hypothetical protein
VPAPEIPPQARCQQQGREPKADERRNGKEAVERERLGMGGIARHQADADQAGSGETEKDDAPAATGADRAFERQGEREHGGAQDTEAQVDEEG